MNFSKIPIVIPTYNRPKSLQRLLESISNADYDGFQDIDLIISCDYSGSEECKKVAENFVWTSGHKKIVIHDENLGLKKHILYCGDLVKDYDGIIMLEDDLWVAPNFYQYVRQASHFYSDQSQVAQISLYNYEYDEISYSPFIPLKQVADNYFMQVPSSWGQFWTKSIWLNFRSQLDSNKLEIHSSDLLPNNVLKDWPDSSWKKHFYKYLIVNNLFVVYPYYSLSTNCGDAGTHFIEKFCHTQARLNFIQTIFNFVSIDNSNVIYDYNYQLHSNSIKKNYSGPFSEFDLEFDLNGQKDIAKIRSTYLVSTKKCKNVLQTFGNELLIQEINILSNFPGNFYNLGKTKDFINSNTNQKVRDRNIQFLPHSTTSEVQKKVVNHYEKMLFYKIKRRIDKFIKFF